jgi:hypothetical protein
MTKQDQAFEAFMAYLRKAKISHMIGIMRLQDAIRNEHEQHVFLRDPWSIKELTDAEAEMVISVIEKLDISSPSEQVQTGLGL